MKIVVTNVSVELLDSHREWQRVHIKEGNPMVVCQTVYQTYANYQIARLESFRDRVVKYMLCLNQLMYLHQFQEMEFGIEWITFSGEAVRFKLKYCSPSWAASGITIYLKTRWGMYAIYLQYCRKCFVFATCANDHVALIFLSRSHFAPIMVQED